MSDFEKDNNMPEFESRVFEVSEEDSTIFSAPEAHCDKVKKGVKLKKIITAAVALVLVAAVTVTIAVTIPPLLDEDKDKDEEISPKIMDEALFDGVDRVTLKREDAVIEYKLVTGSKETEDDDGNKVTETVKEWALKEVDPSLTDYVLIDNTVTSYMEQHYTKKVSDNKNDGSNYGFDKPTYQVDFYKEGSEDVHLSLYIGAENPAKTGRYATTSLDDAVYYIAGVSEFYQYQKKLTDFVEPESIPAIAKDEDFNDDKYTNGQLIKCDKIVVGGNVLGDTYTIESQNADNVTTFTFYKITSPTTRPANDDNVGNIVALFSYGVAGAGCYSYSVTDEDIKRFGLDKPDFDVTVYVDNIKRSFKATKQADGNYAVFYEGNKTIMSVPESSLTPATYDRSDLYNSLLFIENITNAESLTIQSGVSQVKFDIVTKHDKENDTTSLEEVTCNGKEIQKSNFQSYYQYLVGINAQSYEEHDIKGMTPDTVLTLTHKGGKSGTTVKYYKITNARYQVEVNGVKMGLISSSDHTRIMKYALNVAQDKAYNAR